MNLLFLFETDEAAERAATCMGIGLEGMDDTYGMSARVGGMEFAIEVDQASGMWGLFADAPSQSAGLATLWASIPADCPLRETLASEILLLSIDETSSVNPVEVFGASVMVRS